MAVTLLVWSVTLTVVTGHKAFLVEKKLVPPIKIGTQSLPALRLQVLQKPLNILQTI